MVSTFTILSHIGGLKSGLGNRVFAKPLPVHQLPTTLARFHSVVAEFAKREYGLAANGYSAGHFQDLTLLIWKWEDKPNSDFVCIPIIESKFCILSKYWAQYYRFGTLSRDANEFSFLFSLDEIPSLTLKGDYVYFGGHDTFGHWVPDHLGTGLHLASTITKDNSPFLCFNLRDWQADFLSNLMPNRKFVNIDLSSFPVGPTKISVEALWLIDYIDIANRHSITRQAIADVAIRDGLSQNRASPRLFYFERAARVRNTVPRVANSADLRDVVLGFGGVVVDPASLTMVDKIRNFFVEDSIIVNEPGSGETNYSFFSTLGSKLVQLAPRGFLVNPNHHAVQAGWKYLLPRLDSISFLVGNQNDGVGDRLDDYLNAAVYSPTDLGRLLLELLAGVKS